MASSFVRGSFPRAGRALMDGSLRRRMDDGVETCRAALAVLDGSTSGRKISFDLGRPSGLLMDAVRFPRGVDYDVTGPMKNSSAAKGRKTLSKTVPR